MGKSCLTLRNQNIFRRLYMLNVYCLQHERRCCIRIYKQGRREGGGGYPGLLPRGPGQKGARTQTVTNLQVLQDIK